MLLMLRAKNRRDFLSLQNTVASVCRPVSCYTTAIHRTDLLRKDMLPNLGPCSCASAGLSVPQRCLSRSLYTGRGHRRYLPFTAGTCHSFFSWRKIGGKFRSASPSTDIGAQQYYETCFVGSSCRALSGSIFVLRIICSISICCFWHFYCRAKRQAHVFAGHSSVARSQTRCHTCCAGKFLQTEVFAHAPLQACASRAFGTVF